MSPDSAYGHSIVKSEFGEDTENVMLMLHCNIFGWRRRWCQATDAVYASSTGYWDSGLLYEHVSSHFDHPIHQTWVNSRVSSVALAEKIWLIQYSLFPYEITWAYDIIID